VIPQELRESLGIQAGTRLSWSALDGSLLVTPESDDPIKATRGILRGRGLTAQQFLAARRESRAREAKADAPG
jgi:hypothetical protein